MEQKHNRVLSHSSACILTVLVALYMKAFWEWISLMVFLFITRSRLHVLKTTFPQSGCSNYSVTQSFSSHMVREGKCEKCLGYVTEISWPWRPKRKPHRNNRPAQLVRLKLVDLRWVSFTHRYRSQQLCTQTKHVFTEDYIYIRACLVLLAPLRLFFLLFWGKYWVTCSCDLWNVTCKKYLPVYL